MEVEVDRWPKGVGDPRAVFLFRLNQPFGVFDQVGNPERRAVYPLR